MYVMSPKISREAREALKHKLNLDQSGISQYLTFLRDVLSGNLGVSSSFYPGRSGR